MMIDRIGTSNTKPTLMKFQALVLSQCHAGFQVVNVPATTMCRLMVHSQYAAPVNILLMIILKESHINVLKAVLVRSFGVLLLVVVVIQHIPIRQVVFFLYKFQGQHNFSTVT